MLYLLIVSLKPVTNKVLKLLVFLYLADKAIPSLHLAAIREQVPSTSTLHHTLELCSIYKISNTVNTDVVSPKVEVILSSLECWGCFGELKLPTNLASNLFLNKLVAYSNLALECLVV